MHLGDTAAGLSRSSLRQYALCLKASVYRSCFVSLIQGNKLSGGVCE